LSVTHGNLQTSEITFKNFKFLFVIKLIMEL